MLIIAFSSCTKSELEGIDSATTPTKARIIEEDERTEYHGDRGSSFVRASEDEDGSDGEDGITDDDDNEDDDESKSEVDK